MRKHARLYAVLLTAFFLVGIMAAAAAAKTITVTPSPTEVSVGVGSKAVITLTSNAGSGSGNVTAVAWTATVDDESKKFFSIDNESGSVTAASDSSTKINVTGIAKGTGTITLTGTTVTSITVTVVEPKAPTFVDGDSDNPGTLKDGTDLSKVYPDESGTTAKLKAFLSGQTITSSDAIKFVANFTNGYTGTNDANTGQLTLTFKPSLSKVSLYSTPVSEDAGTAGGVNAVSYFVGTMPTVTTDTDYTLTVTAKDKAGSISREYSFTVLAKPAITATDPTSNIIWGDEKGWDFTVTGNNVDKYILDASDDVHFNPDNTSDEGEYWGIKFKDGEFSVDNWKSATTSEDFAWSSGNITKNVKVIAVRGFIGGDNDKTKIENYAMSSDKTFKFTFQPVAPKFSQIDTSYTFAFSSDIAEPKKADQLIIVEGPGELTITPDKDVLKALNINVVTMTSADLEDLEEKGITLKGYTPGTYAALKFTGSADVVATKGTKLPIKAKNKVSEVTSTPTIIIEADAVKLTGDISSDAAIAEKLMKHMTVGDKVKFTLEAAPAPLTWKATGLPAGLKLTPSSKNANQATIEGTIDAKGVTKTPDLTTNGENESFTITATNTDFPGATAAELKGDVIVWAKPAFKTAPSKVLTAKTGEDGIKISIVPSNPVYLKAWSVGLGKDQTNNLVANGVVSTDAGYFTFDDKTASMEGTSRVTVDMDALENGTLSLLGSFDRVPKKGANLPLTVTIGVPVSSNDLSTENLQTTVGKFNIKITGVAPKFAKADWEIDDKSPIYSLDITAGTPPITLKAEIDSSAASKVFGLKKAITLTSADSDSDAGSTNTGLDLTGFKFFADEKDRAGAGGFTYDVSVKDMAFKKLPITITASNTDVNAKATTLKMTVTREGTEPYWVISDDDIPETLIPAVDDGYDVSKDIGDNYDGKLDFYVKGGEAIDDLVLRTDGSFPLNATVKPANKNGIKAVVTTPKEGDLHPYVTFSGKPTAAAKDTATKFTVEVSNPSTGKKDKVDVTFTAKPKPKAAQAKITSKPIVYGKKVKIQPKLSATNAGVVWCITKISDDLDEIEDFVPSTEAGQKAAADVLEKKYGLTLDSAKGTISGTASYATGKSNPLVIEMVASGDLQSSDVVTVTIPVLGEPVKLTTKTVPFTLDEDAVGDVETEAALKVETNLSGITEDNRANVVWSYKAPSEIKDLKLDYESGTDHGGSATASKGVDYSTTKVTKKTQTEITFKNYDTTTKGKLSFTVDGATPSLPGGEFDAAVKYGTSKTFKINVENNDVLSDKLKWKVTTKPSVKGVTASVKAGTKGQATVTVKVGPKVTEESATVGITVTDSTTKKASTEATYNIGITAYVPPEEKSAEAPLVADKPEAVTDTKEDVTSDKELGEGTVKLGNARTAEGLTSAQRAAIEEKGYVIAAVLPEVEVEDASGAYVLEVGELDEAAATGAELVYFAFASKPTTDDEYAIFANAEDGAETTVIPENRKVTVEAWLNVGTKYAPVIAVKANAAAAEAKTEEDVKAKAEEKAEEAKEESKEDSAKTETKEVKE